MNVEKKLDSLIYFGANSFAEMVSFDLVNLNGEEITYSKVIKKLCNNHDLLKQLSTQNLVLIFSELYSDEENLIAIINDELGRRIKAGENIFAGWNIEKDSFAGTSFAWDKLFNSKVGISGETLELLKEKIQEDYTKFKEENASFCENVLVHCSTYDSIGNFLYHLKKGNISKEKMDFLIEISSYNSNLLKRINFGLLQDDIFNNNKDLVMHLLRYPNLSAKFFIIYENNKDLYNHFVKSVKSMKTSDSKSEYYQKIEILLSYYAKNVDDINSKQIDDNLIECAIYNNMQRSEYSENTFTPEEFMNRYTRLDDLFQKKTDIKDLGNIFSSKFFSMSYSKLIKFVDSYGNDDAILKNNTHLQEFLENARLLININEEQALRQLYSSFTYYIKPSEIFKIESEFRRAYAETYVQTMNKTYNYIMENNYMDNGVAVCELTDNFGLPVHSTDSGFKESKKLINDSFVDTWKERADVSDHLISTAYIDQDFLGGVGVGNKGVLYGFLKLEAEDINLIGPTDINSNVRTSYYSAQNTQYYSASKLTRHGRRVYCELATERIGKNPDCVILYDDMSEEVKKNGYQAAREFNIPIVKINKAYIAKQQLSKIDRLIEEVKRTSNIEALCELVCLYETNIAGWLLNKDENNPIVQKGFFKYVNEDGSDANPDRTANIDNYTLASDFMSRGVIINRVILNLIELAKTNPKIEEVTQDMGKVIQLMQQEMKTYAKANELGMPITQTKFSFDGEKIISSAQSVLANVPLDSKAGDSYISITDLTALCLHGENCVTSADLLKAEEQLSKAQENNVGGKNV